MNSEQSLAAAIARFLAAVEPMKTHTRTAWSAQGRQESVAEHSWRLGLLALLVAPHLDGIDQRKLLELAIVHDLGEAFEGDISAPLQSGTDEKGRVELETVTALATLLPEPDAARVQSLWTEYNEAATREARVVKMLDKLETIFQHNQGQNPRDFDYQFNLAYGADLRPDYPLLSALRELADSQTRKRMGESGPP